MTVRPCETANEALANDQRATSIRAAFEAFEAIIGCMAAACPDRRQRISITLGDLYRDEIGPLCAELNGAANAYRIGIEEDLP